MFDQLDDGPVAQPSQGRRAVFGGAGLVGQRARLTHQRVATGVAVSIRVGGG